MTAVAPARPAPARVAADRELAERCGTPQSASWRASAGSGWSSMTTAGTPDRLSSSTIRRPTLRRPHTMTCPRQSAYAARHTGIIQVFYDADVSGAYAPMVVPGR